MFSLAIFCLTTSNLPWFMNLTFQVPKQYCSLQQYCSFHYQSHPQLGVIFTLAQPLHSFWSYFSILLQYHIGHLLTWGFHLSVSYLFAFSYCSWGSQGKKTEVVCHSSGPHFVRSDRSWNSYVQSKDHQSNILQGDKGNSVCGWKSGDKRWTWQIAKSMYNLKL